MSDEPQPDEPTSAARDLDFAQARLAYSIIQTLLEHTRIVSDLIALMAQALDPDTVKALTNTPHWAAYLDSRRALERTRADVEQFTEIMQRLSDDSAD
ncbi:MAG: hypothetical protein DMF64_20045 [Acidobacteria bacterium]|nr:MAG: hypothetical protein DMF64_20045 [Acidobacteriota bacterium]